jgi:hypothetical protein
MLVHGHPWIKPQVFKSVLDLAGDLNLIRTFHLAAADEYPGAPIRDIRLVHGSLPPREDGSAALASVSTWVLMVAQA